MPKRYRRDWLAEEVTTAWQRIFLCVPPPPMPTSARPGKHRSSKQLNKKHHGRAADHMGK